MELEKEFTRQEVDMLIESVDAWVDKDFGGQMMGDMISMLLVPKDAPEEMKAKVKADRELDKRKYENNKTIRKERAIMMKAKLLKIRDSIMATTI